MLFLIWVRSYFRGYPSVVDDWIDTTLPSLSKLVFLAWFCDLLTLICVSKTGYYLTWGSGSQWLIGGSGVQGAPSRIKSQLDCWMSCGRCFKMMLAVSVARVIVDFTSLKFLLSVTSWKNVSIFNGGWAVLDVLCWLIHSLIDWLKKISECI